VVGSRTTSLPIQQHIHGTTHFQHLETPGFGPPLPLGTRFWDLQQPLNCFPVTRCQYLAGTTQDSRYFSHLITAVYKCQPNQDGIHRRQKSTKFPQDLMPSRKPRKEDWASSAARSSTTDIQLGCHNSYTQFSERGMSPYTIPPTDSYSPYSERCSSAGNYGWRLSESDCRPQTLRYRFISDFTFYTGQRVGQ
jgi:hypothetical protein